MLKALNHILYILTWLSIGMAFGQMMFVHILLKTPWFESNVALKPSYIGFLPMSIIIARFILTKGRTRIYTQDEVDEIRARYKKVLDIGEPNHNK
jgi:hypothetical protein